MASNIELQQILELLRQVIQPKPADNIIKVTVEAPGYSPVVYHTVPTETTHLTTTPAVAPGTVYTPVVAPGTVTSAASPITTAIPPPISAQRQFVVTPSVAQPLTQETVINEKQPLVNLTSNVYQRYVSDRDGLYLMTSFNIALTHTGQQIPHIIRPLTTRGSVPIAVNAPATGLPQTVVAAPVTIAATAPTPVTVAATPVTVAAPTPVTVAAPVTIATPVTVATNAQATANRVVSPITAEGVPQVNIGRNIVTSGPPMVTSEQPIVTSGMPIVCSGPPMVTSEQPIVTATF